MMKESQLCVLFVSIAMSACSSHEQPEMQKIDSASNQVMILPVNEQPKLPVIDARKRSYIGCWSSYSGDFMRITVKTLQTQNSYKSLKYRDATDKAAIDRGAYLLEVLEKDKSNFTRPFKSFVMLPKNEMREFSYETRENFLNNVHSGYNLWVKDKCSTVRHFMK